MIIPDVYRVANLSQEECREALLHFVAENCCYGKGPAEKMVMEEIKPSTALHVCVIA